jgi:hypothetical protein
MRAADIAEHTRAIKHVAPRVCAAIQVEDTTLLHREWSPPHLENGSAYQCRLRPVRCQQQPSIAAPSAGSTKAIDFIKKPARIEFLPGSPPFLPGSRI